MVYQRNINETSTIQVLFITINDESLKQLQDIHTQWLEEERQKLLDHHKQQDESWQKQSQRLTNTSLTTSLLSASSKSNVSAR